MFKTVLKFALIWPLLAFAKTSCPDQVEVLAEELLKLEFSGAHLSRKSHCLDQKNFKWVRVMHSPSEENEVQAQELLESMKSVHIKKIEKVHDHRYTVSFAAKTISNKTVQDRLIFLLQTTERSQEIMGCAVILSPPKVPMQLKKCQNP